MAYEQKPNTGSLFKNDKANSENSPQATGSALIDGVDYFVDAWTNVDKNGNRYQSLKFKRKDKQRQAEPRQQSYAEQSGGTARELDDPEIPF